MKHFPQLALLCLLSAASPATAAVVYADFNDNTLGTLGSATVGAGQQGGSGFLAGDTWANTGTIDVIPGDLSAPISTNYAITQGSAVGSHSAQGDFANGRQATRATAATLGTSSDVWFSFLLHQPTNNSRTYGTTTYRFRRWLLSWKDVVIAMICMHMVMLIIVTFFDCVIGYHGEVKLQL